MQYTVIINGQSYDLPGKTLTVVDQMEQVEKIDMQKGVSIREKYRKVFDFLSGMIGRENMKEAFGTDSLDDTVDLNELTLAYLGVKESYEKPVMDFKTSQSMDKFNSLPIDKISNLANAAKNVQQLI